MKRHLAVAAAVIAVLTTAFATANAVADWSQRQADESLTARVLYDCASSWRGTLQHRYSTRVLRVAQRDMPRDVAEYTGCVDAIRYQLRQIRRDGGTIVAGIRRRAGGRLAAGRVALLDQSGRKVDVLEVERGEFARFQVLSGRYVVRADGRRACSRAVRASDWRTSVASVVCPR